MSDGSIQYSSNGSIVGTSNVTTDGNITDVLMSQGPGLSPIWLSLSDLKALLANT